MGGCREIECVYLGMSGTFVIALQRKVLCKTKDFQLNSRNWFIWYHFTKKKKKKSLLLFISVV